MRTLQSLRDYLDVLASPHQSHTPIGQPLLSHVGR